MQVVLVCADVVIYSGFAKKGEIIHTHSLLPGEPEKQEDTSFTRVVVCSLCVGFVLHVVTDGAVVWWMAFTLLIFFASSLCYLRWWIQDMRSMRVPLEDNGQVRSESSIWYRNTNMWSCLFWFCLSGALFVASFLVAVLPSTALALLMASFCLGALFTLGRYITLVLPPLPKDFW
jgi:hypothetical protein